MRNWLFVWFLMGRLALGLWNDMPLEQKEIVMKVCAERYQTQNPDCETVQIVVIQPNQDWVYFFAQCLEETQEAKWENEMPAYVM